MNFCSIPHSTITGLAFETKEELELFIHNREEAKKRDHRKLGKELKLFTISDLVGSGLPLFQPKGAVLRQELEKYLWSMHKEKGYQRVPNSSGRHRKS